MKKKKKKMKEKKMHKQNKQIVYPSHAWHQITLCAQYAKTKDWHISALDVLMFFAFINWTDFTFRCKNHFPFFLLSWQFIQAASSADETKRYICPSNSNLCFIKTNTGLLSFRSNDAQIIAFKMKHKKHRIADTK